MKFQPRLIIGLVRPVPRHAHIARRDAFDRAIFIEQHFGRRKARKYLDTQSLGLLGKPAAQIAQTSGICAFVVEKRWQENMRNRKLAGLRKHPVLVVRDGDFRQ